MAQHRDVAIVNATVRTFDHTDTVATALLMRQGRIALVGTDDQIRSVATADADFIDAGGRTVLPGFIDAHNHLSVAAFEPDAVDCWTPPLATLDEVLARIDAHCQRVPAGQWVIGMGFHGPAVREQRAPTRWELDEVAPRNPFFLIDVSCHAGYANSKALQLVRIGPHTPQPWGGLIEKDGRGEPTGTLLEAGLNLVQAASWNDYAERDWDRSIGLLQAKMNQYLSVGITGVGDAMVTAKTAELYRRADAADAMPFTVQQLHAGDYFFAMHDLRRTDLVDRIKEPCSDRVRGGTMKIYVDRAYPDGAAIDQIHDGCTRHVGSAFYTKEEVNALAVRASELGIGTAIHAMGNCAVDSVLDAYETVRRASRRDSVLRLEHAFVAEPRQGERMASLGVDLVINPGLAYHVGDDFSIWRGVNQHHLKVLPARSMIDAGVRVSLASDHPCGTYSPAEIMGIAITRLAHDGSLVQPEEAIAAAEALRGYTINAAHASGRAAEEGSIEVGKRANLVMVDRDPLTSSGQEVGRMVVEKTWVDGVLLHTA
ncbi:amidohydrolase [Nocardioides ginsengisoli]|uniref:Amidohydrolase n=1 Tax=Nocardioides ginsengisoli TaxID=363868 RepID=A0ABW3VWP6_9ACTN